MVTGALLLPTREGINIFFKRRTVRLIVPFLIWSIIYNLFPWPIYQSTEALPIHALYKMVISTVILFLVTWAFVAAVLRWKRVGKWIMG